MLAKNHLEIIPIFFCCLIFFTWGLSGQEVIGFDSRFYLFAQEMWRNGVSWFPTTYQQPYPDYPATSTVVIYLFALMAGGVNKFIAVLPTAILAAITVVLTYLIGCLHSKRYGLCAVMIILLTSAFVKSARSIALDMYPAVITVGCFYLVYSADVKNKPSRVKWIYPLLTLGFAFRGPIGLVIPTGVVCAYYLFDLKIKKLFLHGALASILLATCTCALLALAFQTGGDVFLQDVLRMEVLGRIDNPYLPRYFYFTDSFLSYAAAYPLAWMTLGGVAYYLCKKQSSKEVQLIAKLFGWMMVILIGMSIPDDKKVRYILAITPAAALIAAYPFAAPKSQYFFCWLRLVIKSFFFIFPLILLLAIVYFTSHTSKAELLVNVNTSLAIMIFATSQMINILILCLMRVKNDLYILGVAVFVFLFTNIVIIEPIQLKIDSAHSVISEIEALRLKDNARLVFYREQPDGLPIKYIINMSSDESPEFISNLEELSAYARPAYFVTSEAYFNELPASVIKRLGIVKQVSIGHIPVVVFKKEGVLSER